MVDFLFTLTQDLHPMVVHFPIVLFFLSFLMALVGLKRPPFPEMEWHLFVLATIASPVAVVTGIIAHRPYEESSLAPVIVPHQLSAILGTLALIALAVWRYAGRRKGKDIGRQNGYRMVALLGLVWIFFVGGTGGQLVY
ncbi:DUF2231 domain-containing protein [Hydrogenibacillus schlegelii]|uniref:DUF2231 domain-containing protein n=1 Tax=Hydrogenibacillus schlegelii TaxID=1484 RepID=A0A132MGA1_HYDSH|nr:DUF2231 domain-containing protein [Hydrogenibacillus schlegelii]KWW96870.1 hypothetical protein TR75_11735 [Hydrogenibacillus schlegelii]OAR05277.1 hypothetical protein SA87_07850 [Hydrogenibacillus schlegelii]